MKKLLKKLVTIWKVHKLKIVLFLWCTFFVCFLIFYTSCSIFQPKKSAPIKKIERITSKSRAAAKINNIINTFSKIKKSLRKKETEEKVITYSYKKTGDHTSLEITLIITINENGVLYDIAVDKTVTTSRTDIMEHLDTKTKDKKEVQKFIKDNL